MEQNAEKAAAFLKSIAHRHRLLVLCNLMGGDMTAGELGETLKVRPANMSQHLSWLKKEGLVASRREGTTVHYSLSDKDVTPFISTLYEMFCGGDKPS
ncbi:MAG: helix-turn-helix transcriptional regulator [Rhodospirillales bacterium]|nr:helix-turn-helix transcriptional regulator [Rhodospirillales bacterium]